MQTLMINTIGERYPIYLGKDLIEPTTFAAIIGESTNKRIALFSDTQVAKYYGGQLMQALQAKQTDCHLFTFPAGESNKNRETKARLEDELCAHHYERDSCFIALGGGVVTDMVGFLSATYCRGVDAIYVPTTLLAMVDACIGGKTAVNTSYGKNLIGVFKQPKAVVIDINLLQTLTRNEWQNGCAEIIKHALIADAALFNQLANINLQQFMTSEESFLLAVIEKNCAIKARIVEQDFQEKGLRQLLNFGHTIGHGIERSLNFAIAHGQAVALGILVEMEIAVRAGLLSRSHQLRVAAMLARYEIDFASFYKHQPMLANALRKHFANLKQFKNYLLHDKKTKYQRPHFVLLNAIGACHKVDNQYSFAIDHAVLDAALQWAAKQL